MEKEEVTNDRLVFEWTVDKTFRVELFSLEDGSSSEKRKLMKRCWAQHVRTEDQLEFLNQLALGNESICRFQDSFVRDDLFHVTWCHQGIRLDEAIKSWSDLAQESSELIILVQLANCVKYLHKNLILHSFINTKNIYLKNSNLDIELGGMIWLEKLDDNEKHSAHERDKLFYKCPENEIGLSYDIWCLGWIFYELCTRTSAQSYLETLESFNEWTPPKISEKKELQDVFAKCVNLNEKKRPLARALFDLPLFIQTMRKISTRNYINSMIGKVITSKNQQGAKYQVTEFLVGGTFNLVFVTVDLHTNQKRALKISSGYSGDAPGRSEAEEEYILENINHPNIIKFYECFTYDAHNICVTDLYPEGDLKMYLTELKDEGRLIGTPELIDYSYQLLKGLKYLHSIKIIHRDIKPSNILMANERKTLKFGDFGVAKQADHTLELCDTQCGSLGYEAPDFLLEPKYTNKIDVWSLGCVIYEMTTLKRAFDFQRRTIIVKYFINSFDQLRLQDNELGEHILQPVLNKMLVVDSKKRASSEALFKEICTLKRNLNNSSNNPAESDEPENKADARD